MSGGPDQALANTFSSAGAAVTVVAPDRRATLTELRIKTDVLDRLMRPGHDNPVETEAGRKLAASIAGRTERSDLPR